MLGDAVAKTKGVRKIGAAQQEVGGVTAQCHAKNVPGKCLNGGAIFCLRQELRNRSFPPRGLRKRIYKGVVVVK